MAQYLKSAALQAAIIVLLGFAGTAVAKSTDCLAQENPVCQKILKLAPKMDHQEAYRLSNHFHRAAEKFHLPVNLLLAIAFQESGLKTDVVRKVSGLVFDEGEEQYKEIRIGADFCMMQIHLSNIKKMDLDVKKLLSDTRYCLENGAKILSRYKTKFAKDDKQWWTYYNASNEDNRRVYFKLVSRHLDKLEDDQKEKSGLYGMN